MIEQTGEEIDWERCPADIEDFPESVMEAFNLYNSLGDRMYPEIGYIGKDFTYLNSLYDHYGPYTAKQKEWIFDLILYIDHHNISESQKRLKSEYDRIKKK